MNLDNCYNFHDFRKLAKQRLPSPIFNYIDGAADDESTYLRNTTAYEDVDLIPNVLRGVKEVDLSTSIFGKKINMPLYCSPTAVQRLFTLMVKELLLKLQKNLEPCLVYLHLVQLVLKKLVKFRLVLKCFNSIFIRIGVK